MPLNIALDGPVGAGKSSVADEVARRLGILHLDTGAMYRAIGLSCLEAGVDVLDEKQVEEKAKACRIAVKYVEGAQRTLVDGRDVTGKLRTPEVSMAASTVARYPGVRAEMVALQQRLARETPMLVDGRDIGTRVLPEATLKVFLTASAEERARRRYLEMQQKGIPGDYETVLTELRARDKQDTERAVDPLRAAEDAVMLDSSELDLTQVVETIIEWVKERQA